MRSCTDAVIMNFYNDEYDEEELFMDFNYYYEILEKTEEDAEYFWNEMSYNFENTNRWDEEATEMELFLQKG